MVRKCIYCSVEVSPDSVIDFCERCGTAVWGEKMFKTIVKNMEDARENNDLCSTNMKAEEIKKEIPQVVEKVNEKENLPGTNIPNAPLVTSKSGGELDNF